MRPIAALSVLMQNPNVERFYEDTRYRENNFNRNFEKPKVSSSSQSIDAVATEAFGSCIRSSCWRE
jgi:hypothetical protein